MADKYGTCWKWGSFRDFWPWKINLKSENEIFFYVSASKYLTRHKQFLKYAYWDIKIYEISSELPWNSTTIATLMSIFIWRSGGFRKG